MSSSINGKQFKEILIEKLSKDSTLLKDSANLFAFTACILSGEPLSLASLIPLVLKTSGSALSSSTALIKSFSNKRTKVGRELRDPQEKFKLIFYGYAQQSYLEALLSSLNKIEKSDLAEDEVLNCVMPEDELTEFKKRMAEVIESIDEKSVFYNFCIDPIDKKIPLFEAYKNWLNFTFNSFGAQSYKVNELTDEIDKEARKIFHFKLASNDNNAKWIRDYLVLEYLEDIPKINSDLISIRESLDAWTDPLTRIKIEKEKAWGRYRKILSGLPDDKDTMYNESFGVREVFVAPQVKYHVSGAEGEAGKPQDVQDISKLFGALISNRIPGDDLIILCGGPGSGKSTLCRMLASELAKNDNMHPVFLKLRRCNEGLDICSFVADNLRNAGVINKTSELHDVPNLTLILDGFDELVMASRQRLRLFFNHLQDDLRTGPFRNAKAIVSGRDTLFPGGLGLPRSSHIVSLNPFDKGRVELWGKKWKTSEKGTGKESFCPHIFFEEDPGKAKKSALHHLVTWPLTLHLVAQVHSAGHLDTTEKSKKNIKKAYLYRSILAETANRQVEQIPGGGRLDKESLRNFLKAIAWEMYIKSVDSLDFDDAITIVQRFFPDASESDLQDLSDTNILNAPEIQKKEDTGFEFVHKSFAEYLVAEQVVSIFEDVCYKVPDRHTKKLTWHMSSEDVLQELSGILGIRIIPEEIQEMAEPMLGCLDHFLSKIHVKDTVPQKIKKEGLHRFIERFSEVFLEILCGSAFRRVQDTTEGKLLVESPLDSLANFAAGVVILGTASARQLSELEKKQVYFQGNPFEDAFWRFIWILHAGGIRLDEATSNRLFKGLTINNKNIENNRIGDWNTPLNFSSFLKIDGYKPDLANSVSQLAQSIQFSQIIESIQQLLSGSIYHDKDRLVRHEYYEKEKIYRNRNYRFEKYSGNDYLRRFIHEFNGAQFIPDINFEALDHREQRDILRHFEKMMHRMPHGDLEAREKLQYEFRKIIDYIMHKTRSGDLEYIESNHYFRKVIDELEYMIRKHF